MTSIPAAARPGGSRHLAGWSLGGLVLGLGLGEVWIAVLQVIVVPLVITQALAAVTNTGPLGGLGVRAVALFVVMLAAAATLTLLVAPRLLGLYRIDPAALASLRASIPVPDAAQEGAGRAVELSDWLRGYIPSSVGRLFQGANLLPVLLGAIILGLSPGAFPSRSARMCAMPPSGSPA